MRALGKLGGHTLLILTDQESRVIRGALEAAPDAAGPRGEAIRPVNCWNAGIFRATERLQGEFDDLQQAKRRGR